MLVGKQVHETSVLSCGRLILFYFVLFSHFSHLNFCAHFQVMFLTSGYHRLVNGNYATDINNPSKLLFQIILLQCFYYLTALVIFYLFASLDGLEFSVDWIFLWEIVSLENTMGLTLFVLWLFDSLLCVLFVTLVVGRSKLAWDFALTIHIINLLIVWVYTKEFPKSLLWWCLQVLSGVVLISLSTYMTRWKELRTTFFDNMLEQQELGQMPGESIEMSNIK